MPPELIDIGCNLTNRRFCSDMDSVVASAHAAGVAQMVITGTSVKASWLAYDIARTRPGVLFATAGVHPHNARTCDDTTIDELRELASRDAVVSIGECGLDYDRDFSPRPVQREWFAAQLRLAAELGLPVFLHEREAHADFAAIVREHRAALAGAVVHCFTGTAEQLEAYLELDLHIGITGWICDDRRGAHLRSITASIPPDRLMIETDAPFLLPRDLPKQPPDRRNEPRFLPHILDRVSRSAGRAAHDMARETTATARRFFGLPRCPA